MAPAGVAPPTSTITERNVWDRRAAAASAGSQAKSLSWSSSGVSAMWLVQLLSVFVATATSTSNTCSRR